MELELDSLSIGVGISGVMSMSVGSGRTGVVLWSPVSAEMAREKTEREHRRHANRGRRYVFECAANGFRLSSILSFARLT